MRRIGRLIVHDATCDFNWGYMCNCQEIKAQVVTSIPQKTLGWGGLAGIAIWALLIGVSLHQSGCSKPKPPKVSAVQGEDIFLYSDEARAKAAAWIKAAREADAENCKLNTMNRADVLRLVARCKRGI